MDDIRSFLSPLTDWMPPDVRGLLDVEAWWLIEFTAALVLLLLLGLLARGAVAAAVRPEAAAAGVGPQPPCAVGRVPTACAAAGLAMALHLPRAGAAAAGGPGAARKGRRGGRAGRREAARRDPARPGRRRRQRPAENPRLAQTAQPAGVHRLVPPLHDQERTGRRGRRAGCWSRAGRCWANSPCCWAWACGRTSRTLSAG